jgi:ankyrin repeat protein
MKPFLVLSLIAMLAAPLLSGCGITTMLGADDDRRIKFDNYFTDPFSARNQPAATSQEKELKLLEKGYARIGTLEVLRVTERCQPKGAAQECTPVTHAADAMAEFLSETAARGGDLVVLERTQEPGTEPYSRQGKCIAWSRTLVYEYKIRYETEYDRWSNRVRTRMAPSMELVPKEICTQYEMLEGKASTSTTAGGLWRLEPDLAVSQQLNQKFLYAAALGRTDEVKRYIAEGLDLKTRNRDGDLVLGIAAVYGHRDVVAALLNAGADINAADLNGTALHRAAANGHLEIVKLLIERKADINTKMPHGRHKGATPLFDAARSGNVELVRFLISSGATVDAPTENGVTPLMIASLEGNTHVIDALVAAGAFVNATSKPLNEFRQKTGWTGGWTPLMLSVIARKHDAQMALIAHGAMITTEAVTLGTKIGSAFDDAVIDRIFALGKKLGSAKRSWGYIDPAGKFVIQPRFRSAEPFSEGVAAVCEHGAGVSNNCGYINKNGTFVIPPKYFAASSFSEGLAAVNVYLDKKDPETGIFGACGYVDKAGKVIVPIRFNYCSKFSEGLAPVMNSKYKAGYIDRESRWVIQPQFASAMPFAGGYASVTVQSMLGPGESKWIDRSGNFVNVDLSTITKAAAAAGASKPKASSGLFPTMRFVPDYPVRRPWGYTDASKTMKIPGPFLSTKLFEEGLAAVDVFSPEAEPFVAEWAALWAEVTRGGNLLQAARKGDSESMEKLLKQGANVNDADAQGMTPLMFAAANGHIKAVKFLLDKGANVNAQNQYGYTALMLVAGSGNVELAQLLVKRGSNLHAKNDLGLTAAEIAELQGDAKIRDLLRKAAQK